jgi:predicted Zn-dependent peptidase
MKLPHPTLRVRARDLGSIAALVLAATMVHSGSAAAQAPAAPRSGREAWGEHLPVVEHTLGNGMRFVILPRPGAPTVSFVVQFEVGGVNESLGFTGTAHLLEHMLFKGTTTVGSSEVDRERELFARMDAAQDSIHAERAAGTKNDPHRVERLEQRIAELEDSARTLVVSNEFDRILSRNGARGLNATTSYESTSYFVELPANRARLWFVLEADRMRNPVFREFYTERDVVMEERRTRVETSPGGLLYEAHMGAAFQMHPYGVPVIGYLSDLESLTRRRVEEYYRRYYGPNNAVVAIVGAVDPDSMVTWAEAYFAGVPPGDEPPALLAREPEQRGERRVVVEYDAEPQVRIGWHVVSTLHPDMPALSMLAYLLTGGRTSRLYRRLVLDDRVATSVSASTAPGARYPQLFVIDAFPRSPHTTQELEAATYEELERLKREAPAESELEKVRNQLEASRIRRLQSNLGLAFQLAGSVALWDDWRETFRLTRRLQGVRPPDIQRVAREYLTRSNRTVATLIRADPPGERP